MTSMKLRAALMALLLPVAGTTIAQTPPPAPADTSGQMGDSVTLAQFQAAQAQRMLAADTDGDGRVSQAEWAAQASARGGMGGGAGGHHGGGHFGGNGGGGGGHDPAQAFARLDTNGDGFIDKAEIDAASAERFKRMDTNGDGILSADERAAMRGGMYRHGGQGGQRDGQPMLPSSSPQP